MESNLSDDKGRYGVHYEIGDTSYHRDDTKQYLWSETVFQMPEKETHNHTKSHSTIQNSYKECYIMRLAQSPDCSIKATLLYSVGFVIVNSILIHIKIELQTCKKREQLQCY